MEQICSTVMSEGGYVETGVEFGAFDGPISFSDADGATARQCVMAIRCKNTFKGIPNRTTVRLTDIEVLSDSTNCRIELWRLPGNSNITGGTWVDADNDSAVEYNVESGAGVIAKRWMAINHENTKELCCSQLAFIHDELQFECHPEHAEQLSASLVRSAEEAGKYYKLRLPIAAEAKQGRDWSEVH